MRRGSRSNEARAYRRLYNTSRWQKKRADHIAANPLCVMCLAEGKARSGNIADHRIPHKGNEILFFEGELDTLCEHHHNSVKQSFERTGKLKGFDDDGLPLDPNHAWNK